MWVAVIMLCTNTLATSCEIRANTSKFFFSKESCEADVNNYGMVMIKKGYGAVPFCFKIGEEA